MLTLHYRYIVAAVSGVLTICFDVDYQSYVPSLADRDHVLAANSNLALTTATAEVAGPAITGMLIQWIFAHVAILVGCGYFPLFGRLCGVGPQTGTAAKPAGGNAFSNGDTRGFAFQLNAPAMRALAGRSVTIYLLFAFHELHMGAGLLGIVIATGGIGNRCLARFAERVSNRSLAAP